MIQPLDDVRFDDGRDLVEVDDHPRCGTGFAQLARDGDVDAIRVPVQPPALPGVVRKHVRRFEPELFANLHDSPGFAARGFRTA